MYGQLNLFAFTVKTKVIYPIPKTLNKQLWKLIDTYDPRPYSFGKFDHYYDCNGKSKGVENYSCGVIVLYKNDDPIGFCTISFTDVTKCVINKNARAYLDVWVMPRYRDMRFGSILVNKANEFCLDKTNKLPDGFDKHHQYCWDKKFRDKVDSHYTYDPYRYYDRVAKEQLELFKNEHLKQARAETYKRLINIAVKNSSIGALLLDDISKKVNWMFREFNPYPF